ncbi:MAG TPA: phosphoribosylamine--glycine ligase [Aestuariivirgaceae bacterium]|jgi:phosphoribosylamine--glycine ligase|nr:phosphoribosylamine--glycine ligase [Aestuariivirgaceae bacterium]
MNILLIGGGGREHALAYAIAASPLLDRLYCAPGNPGTGQLGENVTLDIGDHDAVAQFCRANQIGLVVVGPEAPLVAGIVESLAARGIKAFGPSAAAAQLEGSKGFTKDLCAKAGIPTAAYHRFKDQEAALKHVSDRGAPLVVKLDGLAQGKGVTVAETMPEAIAAVRQAFSSASDCAIVIEDRLVGPELSFFALCDGRHVLPLSTAEDYKRAGDGDTGPNTGGMGAFSPSRLADPALEARVLDEIIRPTLGALDDMGIPYRGVLYAGLMLTPEGPKLIEYNVRFGDPECQVLMLRLKDDIVTLMLAAVDGVLDTMSARFHDEAALTVVMAAKGYPGKVEAGSVIRGLAAADELDQVVVFQAGTRRDGENLVASGGRVLNVTATGPTLEAARQRAYKAVSLIDFPGGFYRRDIGKQPR